MVHLGQERVAAVGHPLEDADLPQRSIGSQRPGHDSGDQRLELARTAGRGHRASNNVEVDIEVRVVDEHWWTKVEWHPKDPTTQYRHVPKPVFNVLPDLGEPVNRIGGG